VRGHFGHHTHFARGHFGHHRHFARGFRFGLGWDDYGCGYGYPYYNLYSCYPPTY
jgi:hypothetical protein